MEMEKTRKECVTEVLKRKDPGRFVYAPNYWQWFAHQKNNGLLPEEISSCNSQLDLIQYLGLDVFSRNIYSNQQAFWFGGLIHLNWDGIRVETDTQKGGHDTIVKKTYHTRCGILTEHLRYQYRESTLVQEKFLVDDYASQLDAFEDMLQRCRFKFDLPRYEAVLKEVGDDGVVVAGEFYSPLKLLHIFLGPVNTTYLIMDQPERARSLMDVHETKQLELIKEVVSAGVESVMAMDNLDTMFHPPHYVEKYSASFYEKASKICHDHGATFFIHACGQQKDNLKLISRLGVDGLEGVAFPSIGDVELDEAMEISGDSFIITGGISAMEIQNLKTRDDVFHYVEDLFDRMRPYRHRFMLSASCNTPINTSWDTIKHFRDAWLEYGC